jgi:NADH-quinone oxidoreductase subunit H
MTGGEVLDAVMNVLGNLFYMLVFPGFLFLSFYGLICEWVDRKLYARFQNRIGPPWYQPEADFIKLMAKEEIIPAKADPFMFRALPIFAMAAVLTAFLYLPVWSTKGAYAFSGDLIVVFFLMTLPTLSFFLAGWHSTSLFATMGSLRNLTQLFAYEVPLFLSLLGPAIIAGTWSVSGIVQYFAAHPSMILVNLLGFIVALIAVQGKLERVPFDIPEAETEIVAGSLVEFTGRLLGIFRLTVDLELVVAATLLSAVFLGGSFGLHWSVGMILFIAKTLGIVALLALFRSVVARIRIEQMMRFCWRYLAPAALVQLLINIIVKSMM